MSTPLGSKTPSTICPTMKASVQAWKKMIAISAYDPTSPLYQIPLESLHYLSPDLALTQWTLKGIHSLQNLIQGKQPKRFPLQQKEFDLPSTEFFTYIRIHHCLKTIPLPLYTIPPKTWELLTLQSPKQKAFPTL